MFVVTVDQRASRRVGDRVPEVLHLLTAELGLRPGAPGVVRQFERTVGDEIQGVLDDPAVAVDTALALLRTDDWYVGIGAGPVVDPLPASTRAASGAAFVRARTAVERAKGRGRGAPVAVDGEDEQAAQDAQAVLTLLGAVVGRRTEAGWAVVDALEPGGVGARQEDVAEHLGISQQAVSQRLQTALWSEELAVRDVVARLLDRAQGEDQR